MKLLSIVSQLVTIIRNKIGKEAQMYRNNWRIKGHISKSENCLIVLVWSVVNLKSERNRSLVQFVLQ